MIPFSASVMIVEAISGGRGHFAGTGEMSEAEVLQRQIAEARISARAASAHQRGLVAWLARHNPLSGKQFVGAETAVLGDMAPLTRQVTVV